MEPAMAGMNRSKSLSRGTPPHIKRIAWEWIVLLSSIAESSSTKGLVELLISLHRLRSTNLRIGMAFFYPQVRANLPKYKAHIKRWRKRLYKEYSAQVYRPKYTAPKEDEKQRISHSPRVHINIYEPAIMTQTEKSMATTDVPIKQGSIALKSDDPHDVITTSVRSDQAQIRRQNMRRMLESTSSKNTERKSPSSYRIFRENSVSSIFIRRSIQGNQIYKKQSAKDPLDQADLQYYLRILGYIAVQKLKNERQFITPLCNL